MQPAINYARDGFPVSEVIAYYLDRNTQALKNFPNIKETYMPGGKSPEKGEIFKNPRLAGTLEKIVKGGRNEFYRGSIAKAYSCIYESAGRISNLRRYGKA